MELPERQIWRTMIHRCHNPISSGYPAYGARGIEVCPEWRIRDRYSTGFRNFLRDMGLRPSLSTTRLPAWTTTGTTNLATVGGPCPAIQAHQRAALASLCYNIGPAQFGRSDALVHRSGLGMVPGAAMD